MDRGAWPAIVHAVARVRHNWAANIFTDFSLAPHEYLCKDLSVCLFFPGSLAGKESVCHSGDPGSIPGSGRSPGEENGNPLQYSCQENSMDRGGWQATIHGVAKSRTQLRD